MGQVPEVDAEGSREGSMRFSWTRCEIEKIRKILNETDGLNYLSIKDANFMLEKICEALTVDEKKNGWIPVGEKMPKTATPVLCSVESTDISEARIHIIGSYHNDCWFLQSSVGLHSFPVTEYKVRAWMSLPELYKGDSNE